MEGHPMFTLNIETDNAAFQDGDTHAEITRILRDVTERIEAGADRGPIRDINGNTVGSFLLAL